MRVNVYVRQVEHGSYMLYGWGRWHARCICGWLSPPCFGAMGLPEAEKYSVIHLMDVRWEPIDDLYVEVANGCSHEWLPLRRFRQRWVACRECRLTDRIFGPGLLGAGELGGRRLHVVD